MTQRAGGWTNREMRVPCKNGEHGTIEDEMFIANSNIIVTTTSGEFANGNGGLVFDTTASLANVAQRWPIFFLPVSAVLMVVHGFLKLSATPTSEVTIWSDTGGQQLRINTSKQLAIYDKSNNLLNTPADSVLFSTSAFVEFYVFFDGKTDSGDVMIWVVQTATEKEAFLSGKAYSAIFDLTSPETGFGDPDTPSGGVGCKLFMDDIQMRRSNVAADSPDLLAYPRLKSAGGESYLPKVAGTASDWSNDYTYVDETGAHDGDTTKIIGGVVDQIENWKSTDANPIPSSPTPTIEAVHFYGVGKIDVEGKDGAGWQLEIHGNENVSLPTVIANSLSYKHQRWSDAPHKPANGGPQDHLWHHADFDANTLIWGVKNPPAPQDPSNSVTKLVGPTIVYHTAHLPLLTARPVAAGGHRRHYPVGVKRGVLTGVR